MLRTGSMSSERERPAHRVPLLPTVGESMVGECVPEAVQVDVGEAGLHGADVDHIACTVGAHRAVLAEQQLRRTEAGMQRADPRYRSTAWALLAPNGATRAREPLAVT